MNYLLPISVAGKLIGLAIGVVGLGNLSIYLIREARENRAMEIIHWLFVMIAWTGLLIMYAVTGFTMQWVVAQIY